MRIPLVLLLVLSSSGALSENTEDMEGAADTSGILLEPARDSGMVEGHGLGKTSSTVPSVVVQQTPEPTVSLSPSPSPTVDEAKKAERYAYLRNLENREAVQGLFREGSSYPMHEFDRKVSLIIKTFERSSCLLKYVESIRHFYPTMPILIADDSQQISNTSMEILSMKNVRYFPLPFDSGVGAGRNFLLDHVKTPFFIVSDDDNVFTADTKLENILADIESSGADIVGACNHEGDKSCIGDWDLFYRDRVRNPFHKRYEAMYSTLQVREVPHMQMERVVQRDGTIDPRSPYCKESDMVANFFIGRTAFVGEQVRWDPFFKVGEHEDFFYRAKIARASIRFCTHTQVKHEHFTCLKTTEQHRHYKTFRDRVRGFLEHFFVKHEPVTRMETPWATITWNCKCADEYYASEHGDECMAPMENRTDCSATWDTDRVTTPTDEEQQRWNDLLSRQPSIDVQDGVEYSVNQGLFSKDTFQEAMTAPPHRLDENQNTFSSVAENEPVQNTAGKNEAAAAMMKSLF